MGRRLATAATLLTLLGGPAATAAELPRAAYAQEQTDATKQLRDYLAQQKGPVYFRADNYYVGRATLTSYLKIEVKDFVRKPAVDEFFSPENEGKRQENFDVNIFHTEKYIKFGTGTLGSHELDGYSALEGNAFKTFPKPIPKEKQQRFDELAIKYILGAKQ